MSSITPSPEQRNALDMINDWFRSKRRKSRFILTGVAGSGKSSILKILVDELELDISDIAFVAYTGKASLVLTNKGVPATTIHRLMYIPREVQDPDNPDKMKIMFRKREELPDTIRLVCVDEASMVSNEIQDDLESFGVPVLYIGDHWQLRPVQGDCRIFTEPDVQLNQIHRQAEGNPIIAVSRSIREGRKVPFGMVGGCFMKTGKGKPDPHQMGRANQVICGRNDTRHKINAALRIAKGFDSDLPMVGDKIINLKNNWDVGLVNGHIGHVSAINEVNEALNYILLDFVDENGVIYSNLKCFISSFRAVERPSIRQKDSLPMFDFNFAYAITCHKAQGSQWDLVYLQEEQFKNTSDEEHAKWVYTGVTRAARKLIWVA